MAVLVVVVWGVGPMGVMQSSGMVTGTEQPVRELVSVGRGGSFPAAVLVVMVVVVVVVVMVMVMARDGCCDRGIGAF